MISLKWPSLAFNSNDVPEPWYEAWGTWDMPEGTQATAIVRLIYHLNMEAGADHDTYLKNVVINCHGGPGKLHVGGLNKALITEQNVDAFAYLKDNGNRLGTIWLVACQAAKDEAGKKFCRALAMNAGCTVVAADDYQVVEASYQVPYYALPILGGLGGVIAQKKIYKSTIDEYEGNVFCWDAQGRRSECDPHKNISTAD